MKSIYSNSRLRCKGLKSAITSRACLRSLRGAFLRPPALLVVADSFWSYLDKTVAAGLLGKIDTAEGLLDRVNQLHLDFINHPRYYVSSFVIGHDLVDKMMEGLNKAGLRTA